jgi:uncharacterized membrane protein
MRLVKPFIVVSVLGIVGALYHAWSEGAFSTNYGQVSFSQYGSFYGVPYWVFGVVWFPLMLVVALWSTKLGSGDMPMWLLILLTVGNVFTGYLWFLDLVVIKAFTAMYVALYSANYALTALLVAEHWSNDVMRGYVYGTITGAIVGLLFGPYGVAACGIGGGIFGALRNYFVPIPEPPVGLGKSKNAG